MTTPDIDPIHVQFNLLHDCIRASVFGDYIQRTKPKAQAWLSLCDMCYSDAVMSWNSIFGSDSQETHWKNLLKAVPLPERGTLKPFSKEMIIGYLKTNETEWARYHSSMVKFRNTRLAHFNHTVNLEEFPNITWAQHSAYLYREWLISLLMAYRASGQEINITETTGPQMLDLFKAQIAEICS